MGQLQNLCQQPQTYNDIWKKKLGRDDMPPSASMATQFVSQASAEHSKQLCETTKPEVATVVVVEDSATVSSAVSSVVVVPVVVSVVAGRFWFTLTSPIVTPPELDRTPRRDAPQMSIVHSYFTVEHVLSCP